MCNVSVIFVGQCSALTLDVVEWSSSYKPLKSALEEQRHKQHHNEPLSLRCCWKLTGNLSSILKVVNYGEIVADDVKECRSEERMRDQVGFMQLTVSPASDLDDSHWQERIESLQTEVVEASCTLIH